MRRIGELLHILQPLTHLASLALCGPASWKPFLLSLAMDCSSLSLHSQEERLTERERRELVRRRLALLSYLLRSPLYDRRSKVIFDFYKEYHRVDLTTTLLCYRPSYFGC